MGQRKFTNINREIVFNLFWRDRTDLIIVFRLTCHEDRRAMLKRRNEIKRNQSDTGINNNSTIARRYQSKLSGRYDRTPYTGW
jgi:hypothetical protein